MALPVLVILALGVMEVGTVFYIRHIMVHAAWDATRSYAIQGVTGAQAEQIALDRLESISASFTVTATEQPSVLSDGTDVTVEIRVPRSDVTLGAPLGLPVTGDIRVQTTMRKQTD